MGGLEADYDFEIFNLGNSETVQLHDLIELIGEKMGMEPEIDQQPEQLGDVPVTYADISKPQEQLGYNPQVSIEKGIELFVDWYKDQNNWS